MVQEKRSWFAIKHRLKRKVVPWKRVNSGSLGGIVPSSAWHPTHESSRAREERQRGQRDRRLGKPRFGGLGMIQAGPMAALAADSPVFSFRRSSACDVDVDRAKPCGVTGKAVVYRLSSHPHADVISRALGGEVDALGLPPDFRREPRYETRTSRSSPVFIAGEQGDAVAA